MKKKTNKYIILKFSEIPCCTCFAKIFEKPTEKKIVINVINFALPALVLVFSVVFKLFFV